MCPEKSSLIKNGQEQWLLNMKSNTLFFIISHSVLLRMRKFSDKSCRQIQSTHFMFDNYSIIMWKNIVQPGRPHMTIWRTRIACRIPKATNRHSEYILDVAFPLQYLLHEYASMLRYRYADFLVRYKAGANETG
jgi:hypothetical protein